MKKPTLYIPVNLGHSMTLISANRILKLEEFLPTLKMLQNHMLYERRACELDPERRPQPLNIVLENTIFNDILGEIKSKGKVPERYKVEIPLIAQSGNAPIARIFPRDSTDDVILND